MKAATELKPVITRGEFSEAPWPIWERGGFERGPDQEDLLRAEQHEIAEAAWQIWQSEGRQDGRALAYWLRAEQQHLAARQQEGKRTQAAAVNRRILLARAKSSARGRRFWPDQAQPFLGTKGHYAYDTEGIPQTERRTLNPKGTCTKI